MTLFSSPTMLPDADTKKAFDRLIRELSREGIPSFSYMVPLYDEGERVRVVAEEESGAGPDVVDIGWTSSLTVDLELERDITYRIHGTASCDLHLDSAGAGYDTCSIRVHDGSSALNALYASSGSVEQYVPITVPFTLEVEATSTLTFSMDSIIIATTGGTMHLERLRLIAVAVPIHLEGSGT